MRDTVRSFLVFFIFLFVCQRAVGDVRGDYRSPLFTVPYATKAPNIDGVVDDVEWKDALEVNALQTTEGKISTRQTRVWMMWDEDHLYIAMRSPLRAGERVIQAFRQRGRDNSKVVFDDSYEIWLNADTQSPDGQKVFFQYLGNAAGAKYDVMFQPAVGNSRPGWESGWKPANRVTPDGKFWEMEVAITRASIYRDRPFNEGTELRGLFVRNFKGPWEQNSVGGSGSFSAPDSHCKFILSKTAPAVHLLGVADSNSKTFGLNLAVSSSVEHNLKWTFESDDGTKKTGDLDLANQAAPASVSIPDLDRPGDGYFRIRVTSTDGKITYLDWCSRRAFGDFARLTPPPDVAADPVKLTLSFNPARNYLRIDGDFINDDNRAALHRFYAEVLDGNGKQLAASELHLDELAYVHGLLQLGQCPPGAYVARLTCYDVDGKQVMKRESPFVKKDAAKEFAWWNTKAGNIEKVIAPWTPVHHDGAKIEVWGRTIQIGSAGLPAQVSTQGQEILAGPISMIAGNDSGAVSSGPSNLQTESDADHRAVVLSQSDLGNIHIATRITAEFDGMYKVGMTLSPRKSVSVNTLKIVIPIKPEFASYFHACGEGIRYGFSYGYLPAEKKGQLWSSKEVDGQPMLVGSFIPYVWIGNDKGGLCWFADSDEGWSPNDSVPAIEIRRDSDSSVDLVLNLISSKTNLDQPHTITFAFQATPVKPLQPGWRMDTWSTADTFKDFCRVEPHGGHLIWNALPFTLDPAACKQMVDERHSMNSMYNFGIDKYHANATPYFENNKIDEKFAPEVAYFGDQWHAGVSDSLCYDKTLSDFIIYHLGEWCKQCGIDGWYVDNVRPVACDNIDAGRGYRLPDGRIQPTYQMFATRDFFLRVRAVFAENGKSGKFVLHMTNHMILPWIGAADLALDGEDHVTFPEMGKDFIDFWSPARMRLDYPAQSGVALTFLEEYQGSWEPAQLRRVMRAYTAMSILNDVLPGANPNGNNQEVWRGRDRFGIESQDVTFVPYWDKASGISCEGPGLYASAWKKPNQVLLAIVNTGEKIIAVVHFDPAKLGLPSVDHCKAIDADTGDALSLAENGSLRLPVERHDYRQVIIQAAAN